MRDPDPFPAEPGETDATADPAEPWSHELIDDCEQSIGRFADFDFDDDVTVGLWREAWSRPCRRSGRL